MLDTEEDDYQASHKRPKTTNENYEVTNTKRKRDLEEEEAEEEPSKKRKFDDK